MRPHAVLFIDIPGASNELRLALWAHGQAAGDTGWNPGLGPWEPVLKEARLYGRGAADDGYAMFACLAAIGALQAQSIPHARCVIMIEACEESGSFDLPFYIDHLGERIGKPSLVIALDSGCASYEQLWCTTSLRGLAGGTLKVEVLSEGVHSGDAGGVVPDSFRIVRQLLSRLEDETTGNVLPADFHVQIPEARQRQAVAAGAALGETLYTKFPLTPGARPLSTDPTELILNRTWRPALSIIGADGLPPPASAGNVMRPMTALKLSLRLPPTCDGQAATRKLQKLMEQDPPGGARVSFEGNWAASGWNAPALAPWLKIAGGTIATSSASRPHIWARAAQSPSLTCWASAFPRRNSWSLVCWAPMRSTRPQRVSPHPHGQAGHLLRGQGDRGSFSPPLSSPRDPRITVRRAGDPDTRAAAACSTGCSARSGRSTIPR